MNHMWTCVLVIFAGSQIWTEIHGDSNVPFGGNCPNITTTPIEGGTNASTLGVWYVYAARPKTIDQNIECAFVIRTLINGTIHIERHQYNTLSHQWMVVKGYYVFAGNETFIVYTYPYEFISTQHLIGFGDGFVSTYSCSECGFYGYNDGGFFPSIYTRVPEPNCLVTDPLWALLNSQNITQSMFNFINQTNCNYTFAH